MTAYYLDSSAAVKLVVAEPGSAELLAWIRREDPDFVSSELMRAEVLRACRRYSPDAIAAARDMLDAVTLIAIGREIVASATFLDPADMRTLDALHIATALSLGDDLAGVLTYDDRFADGCRAYGLRMVDLARESRRPE